MTTYSAEQDADTPLARWRFEEPSGTTFTDDVTSVVATITGTVTPGSTYPSRPGAGGGGDFAGGGASMTGVSAWRPQTIEALISLDTIPSTARPWIFGHDLTTGSNAAPLILGYNLDNANAGKIGVGWWTGSAYRVAHVATTYTSSFTDGLPHHVVGVYDGSTNIKVYIDGVQRISATVTARGTLTTVSGTAWIGRRFDGSATIDGRIWDLALYNGALSAARVTAHYDATLLPAGIEITTGGGPFFDGVEGSSPGGELEISGGGRINFRATNLDATRPSTIHFDHHPNDVGSMPAPWNITEGFSEGTKFTPVDHSTWVYTPGGQIERVLGSVRATRTDANFLALVAAADPSITNPTEWGPAYKAGWTAVQQDWDVRASVGAWPALMRWTQNLYVAWQRITSDLTTDKDVTIWWSNLCVLHKRYNYLGGVIPAVPTLTARGLVHDLIGRGLGEIFDYDPVRVAPGTPWSTLIGHAAWWDGVSAREVLALATTYAPGMWWQVVGPGASGRPKLEIGRWDGPARYVFPRSAVRLEMSGGAGDLANRCLVRYIGTTFGQSRTTWVAEVRANVRGLAEAGLSRTMTLDLTGEEMMTPQQARLRGVSALRQAAQSKTAGSVTISGPIYDHVEGRMVEPWEVKAGSPVIASDAPVAFSRSTSLAESVGADGISVFRARAMSYDASSNTATLSLDGGARSLIGRFKTEAAARRYSVGSSRT